MIVYGASGHGKVIIDILELNGIREIKVWDDAPKGPLCGYYATLPDTKILSVDTPVIISIGDNTARRRIVGSLPAHTAFHNAVHPKAIVAKSVSIEGGTVLMAGVCINSDAIIGKHCIINTNAVVDHDCIIGNYVHISPNVTLCGNVIVGEGTHVGAGAVVIPGKKIGKWCTVGAGAVIIQDVPDGATVVGNPARIIKTKEL